MANGDVGVASELSRINFGKDLADALGNIGKSVKQYRDEQEAQRIMQESTGIDLSNPEGIKAFQSALYQLAPLGQAGQTGISTMEQAIEVPYKVQAIQEGIQAKKLQEAKNYADPFNRKVEAYISKFTTPGVTEQSLQPFYDNLDTERKTLSTVLGNNNNLLNTIPHPTALRGTPTVTGGVIESTEYQGKKAPAGSAYQFYFGVDENGKSGYHVVKDEGGSPLMKPLTTSSSGMYEDPSTWAGNWNLWDKNVKWNQAFLDSLPVQVRGGVQALAENRADIKTFNSLMRGNQREKYRNWVTTVSPRWEEGEFPVRKASMISFTSGYDYKIDQSLNLATGHLGKMYDAVTDLKNEDINFWNRVANAGIRAVGDPRVDRFNFAADTFILEYSRAVSGKSGTIEEIDRFNNDVRSIASPQQLVGVINEATDLLKTRFKGQVEGFKQGTHLPIDRINFLQPETRIFFHHIGREDVINEILGRKVIEGIEYEKDENGDWYPIK